MARCAPALAPPRRARAGLRHDIGRAILLGLEVLVAADIVRTVAFTPTLASVEVLADRGSDPYLPELEPRARARRPLAVASDAAGEA